MIDLPAVAGILSIVLCAALGLTGWRLMRGPTFADRFVAFDMLTALGVAFAGLSTVSTGRSVFLDVALGIALINFAGTAAFALLLERKARTR